MKKVVSCITLVACLALGGADVFAASDYGEYRDFSEVEAQLKAWAKEHPQILSLETLGKSADGKPIHLARLAGSGPVPADQRPAVFVGANIAGFHNAGTEAALHLIERLLAGDGNLATATYYVAPVLNPDAHNGLFAPLRQKRAGAGGRLDRDVDGLFAEDAPNDLDGDGRITGMRIPDPAGKWLPHPQEPRLMVQADAAKGWIGAFRIASEGGDDDGDGKLNEDGAFGVVPDKNFAHGWPFPDAEAGLWPSISPESQAIMDSLLRRRNIALAVVYGPANNFLATPKSFGGSGDLGTMKFKIPEEAAKFIGLDPEVEYTLDEVWDVVKEMPFAKQNSLTKDQVAQFLGAGPATQMADGDLETLAALAKDYKKRLKDGDLGDDRPAEQYSRGGLTPWLYYQYGVFAVELDVWGIPKAKKESSEKEGEAGGAKLTLESLGKMSSADFLALGKEKIAAFIKEIGAPAQITADMVIQRVEAGQIDPPQMAQMMSQMGGGGAKDDPTEDSAEIKRQREVLAWAEQHAAEAIAPWSSVKLADGTTVEVGGLDPFLALAPPMAILRPALAIHTATVIDLASKLARVEILSLEIEPLGSDVYRVKAIAGNRGELATHSEQAVRARAHLPTRLALAESPDVRLITGPRAIAEERLAGRTGTLRASWLIRANPGSTLTVRLTSDNAGSDQKTAVIGAGASR